MGVCVIHGLSVESQSDYERYSIGDEIDVKVAASKNSSDSEGRFILTQSRISAQQSTKGSASFSSGTLEEG